MRSTFFAAAVVSLALVASSAHAETYVMLNDIQTVTAGSGGVTFSYGSGEGHPSQTVTIAGDAGSDCLRLWMFIEAYRKSSPGDDSAGFVLEVGARRCRSQLRVIGA